MFRYDNLRIFLLTLAFGLAFVRFVGWARDYTSQIYVDLPEASSEVFVVDVNPDYIDSPFPIAYGCGALNELGGHGAIAIYQWAEFSVSRSGWGYDTRALAKRDIASRVADAAEVLEDSRWRNPKAMPVRLVLSYSAEDGKDNAYFEIVTYDGDNTVIAIDSRDFTTALRFALWDQARDARGAATR